MPQIGNCINKKDFAKFSLVPAAGFAVNALAASPAATAFQEAFKVNKSCPVIATNLNLGEVDSTGRNAVAGTNGTVIVNCSNKSPCAIGLLHSGGACGACGACGGSDSVAALTMSHCDTVAYALFSNVGLGTAGKPATSDQFPPG